jgi:hypothetical protein
MYREDGHEQIQHADYQLVSIPSECRCYVKLSLAYFVLLDRYVEELLAMHQAIFYLRDAAISLLLWRGTTPVQVQGLIIFLPIHSLTAFILSALAVERPQYLPSFALFGIAWLLLATMEYRRHIPDVWSRCKSFKEIAECFVFGESGASSESIAPYTESEATDAFMKQWQQRIVDAEDAASKAYEELAVEPDDDSEVLLEHSPNSHSSPKRGSRISLDPFRPILFPVGGVWFIRGIFFTFLVSVSLFF